MKFRQIIIISLLLLFSSPAYSQGPSVDISDPLFSNIVNPQRTIVENDKLLISIRKVPELSGGFNVDQSGMVELELLGKVKTAGLKPAEFEKVLAELYGRDYLQDPFIRIEIVSSFSAEDIMAAEAVALPETASSQLAEITEPGPQLPTRSVVSSNQDEANLDFIPLEDFLESQAELNNVLNDVSAEIETQETILLESVGAPDPLPLETPSVVDGFLALEESETIGADVNLSNPDMSELGYTSYAESIAIEPEANIETFADIIELTPLENAEIIVDGFTLEETNWTFESDPRAFMQFLPDGKIAGYTGCNNFFANYIAEETFITIQFVASTFNICADIKDGEFQDALESITSFEYSEADKLTLLDKDNEEVLILSRGFDLIVGK